MSKKIIILLIILVVIVVAIVMPFFKSDGLKNLTGNEKRFGESALLNTRDSLNNPVQKLIILKVKIRQISKQESDKQCDIGFTEPFMVTGDYFAIIDAYTFFGIRYASVNISCSGGTVIGYF